MSSAGNSSTFWPACVPVRRSFVAWLPRGLILGLMTGIAGMVAVDLHRKAEIDRSLAAICRVGVIYLRDEESRGSPVVCIHFVSYVVDDAGRVHRRGRARIMTSSCSPDSNSFAN